MSQKKTLGISALGVLHGYHGKANFFVDETKLDVPAHWCIATDFRYHNKNY